VTQQDGERLLVQDLFATWPFSLRDALSRRGAAPARTIEFGFHPELWWPNTETLALDDGESRLFVRGAAAGVTEPVRFPNLHTRRRRSPRAPSRQPGVVIQPDQKRWNDG
jgi:hypothetical protein